MAILRSSSQTENNLSLTINNGDLEALQDTVARLGFKDEESTLRFMLAVLSKSATRSLIITDKNGAKIPFTPSEGLLKPSPHTKV